MKALTALFILATAITPPTKASEKAATPTQNISIKVGECHQIEYPSNPSTGYTWQLIDPLPEDSAVNITFTPIAPSQTQALGAPGKMRIIITGKKVGKETCKITYCRPFDKINTQSKTQELRITVE